MNRSGCFRASRNVFTRSAPLHSRSCRLGRVEEGVDCGVDLPTSRFVAAPSAKRVNRGTSERNGTLRCHPGHARAAAGRVAVHHDGSPKDPAQQLRLKNLLGRPLAEAAAAVQEKKVVR